MTIDSKGGFTPGPWFHGPFCVANGNTHRGVGLALNTDGSTFGCRGDEYLHISGIMQEGDARLIASAPDLLEALQGLFPSNMCTTNNALKDDVIVPCDVTMGELRKAAAALSKALGTEGVGV